MQTDWVVPDHGQTWSECNGFGYCAWTVVDLTKMLVVWPECTDPFMSDMLRSSEEVYALPNIYTYIPRDFGGGWSFLACFFSIIFVINCLPTVGPGIYFSPCFND